MYVMQYQVKATTSEDRANDRIDYHSLLYRLLSVSYLLVWSQSYISADMHQWEQPRATAVSFVSVIAFIFAARYLPLLRWFFKFTYLALGCELLLVFAFLRSLAD